MVGQFHELLASRFVRRLDKNRPDGMNAEGLLVPLLLLDEVVVSAELLKHVGYHHRAAVSFVEEVSALPIFGAILKAHGKESIRLDRQSFGLVNLLPEELARLSCGFDLRYVRLVTRNLSTLAPRFKRGTTSRFSACHFDHEVHPRNHETVAQKSELHVLATKGCTGIVLLAMAANLFEHLRVDFKASPLGQQVRAALLAARGGDES